MQHLDGPVPGSDVAELERGRTGRAAAVAGRRHRCGALGYRKKHDFACPRCHYHAHSDANAALWKPVVPVN